MGPSSDPATEKEDLIIKRDCHSIYQSNEETLILSRKSSALVFGMQAATGFQVDSHPLPSIQT